MAELSPKIIRNRIRTLGSTRQITRAMEMVSAAKLRGAQQQLSGSRPYDQTLRTLLDETAPNSPWLRPEGGVPLCLVIAGDRGLAGGYNANILRLCPPEPQSLYLPIGRKALEFCRGHGYRIFTDAYAEAAGIAFAHCRSIAQVLADGFLAGQFRQITLGYTEFVSMLDQRPILVPLLPLEIRPHRVEMLYEPDTDTVTQALVRQYLAAAISNAVSESRCAELAARRTAMDAATSNTDEMIASLRLQYNRARQAAITREITEIVAGTQYQ